MHCYYLLRYYYTAKHKEIKYKLKEKYIPKKGKIKKEIILDFNGIEIINKNLTKEMKFKIYGFLYKYENDIKNEFINPYLQNRVDRAQTMLDINNDFNFSLIFNDIKSYDNNDYKYYLQIKIYSSHKNNLLVDELFMYALKVDLTDIFKSYKYFIIIIIFISAIIIIIIIFTIIIFIMKKKNKNLKERVLATSFASGNISDNIIDKSEKSIKDDDSENTFI